MKLILLLIFLIMGFTENKTHVVLIEDMKFIPAVIKIKAGETISWKNNDLVLHSATSENNTFDSKSIYPGKSWTAKFSKKGKTDYSCRFHPIMKAIVIVE